MIGRLHGKIIEKYAPLLLIDVSGVGYEVYAPMTTFYRLPEIGAMITLHTHLVIREDAQLLYAFYDKQERSLFKMLIKVNGVGPKMALAILSGIEVPAFVRSVQNNDTATLVRLPGIGKKTAERLVIEMRDRLKDWEYGEGDMVHAGLASNDIISTTGNGLDLAQNAAREAESALVALGYKPQEASKAIMKIKHNFDTSEALIRAALKNMVS